MHITPGVDESLTEEEREALRDSIESSGRKRAHDRPEPPEARPVALIAEDQATERVRPIILRVAERWGRQVCRIIPPIAGVKVEVELEDEVETDPAEIIAALGNAWLGQITPGHGMGAAMVAVTGRMIPDLAATMLGGVYGIESERPPTSATLKVFSSVGRRAVEAAIGALEYENGGKFTPGEPPASVETWDPIVEGGPLVLVRLRVTGETEGTLLFVASPSALVVPTGSSRHLPDATPKVRKLLAEVEAEISVQLGSTQVSASEFAAFEVGTVVELDALVGDPVRVLVEGQLRAMGHAVLLGEVVAVEVADVSSSNDKREVAG